MEMLNAQFGNRSGLAPTRATHRPARFQAVLAKLVLLGVGLLVTRLPAAPADDYYRRLYAHISELVRTNAPAALKEIDNLIAAHPTNGKYYHFRGGVHESMNQPLLAIADFTKGIELKAPGDSIIMQRAMQWLRLGYLRKSLADLDTIAEMNPGAAFDLWQRGLLLYEFGDFEGAAKQFVANRKAHAYDVEDSVWIVLCQARVEDLKRAREAMLPVKGDTRVPMEQIFALFQGTGSEQQVLDAAAAAPPSVLRDQIPTPAFYAQYYLGLYADLMGDRSNALSRVQAALDTPMRYNVMQDFARARRDGLLRAFQTNFTKVPARILQSRAGLGNFFGKLTPGAEVRIAYFGGSITAAQGWRIETMKWFRETYPAVRFEEINAAIGGTGSDLGAFRFGHDVLSKKPDLVFVEFSVNDGGAEPARIWPAVEGFLRQGWKADESTDFCFVYTFADGLEKDLQAGVCPRAASADEILAQYYDIPSINVALPIASLAAEKKLIIKPATGAGGAELPIPDGVTLFSKDGVHPLPAGHQLYFEAIRDSFETMTAMRKPAHWLKHPFTTNNWSRARLVPVSTNMLAGDWKMEGEPLASRFKERLPSLWTASKPGALLSFKYNGSIFGIYDLMGPDAGQAVCVIDGRTNAPISRFDSFSSYTRLASFFPDPHLPEGTHEVRVYLDSKHPDKKAVMEKESRKPGFDPNLYEAAVLKVGGVMIMGDEIHE